MSAPGVIVSGAFDNLSSRDLRFLEEASKLGSVTVLLWTDEVVRQHHGRPPKFPFAERDYLLRAIRHVGHVVPLARLDHANELPRDLIHGATVWADVESGSSEIRRQFARKFGIGYRVMSEVELRGFPEPPAKAPTPGRKKVMVTGCYDWLHSGHVRFFEDAGTHGELIVVVGHDANIRLLKGEGHPLQSQEERRYAVGAIKFVSQALISTGHGWLDAEPEIQRIRPDIYAVNDDGNKGGKRDYCAKNGIEYLVLRRAPAPGLPARTSTELRGF
jgi:cytidyltransferase-like protein